ncbi:predicted protein [Uncinocarpus reesii 1704]|uniref:Pre-rRNA processing protein n=1 Tax=Uncinocarpus reesii (strain UAMH 1704) TaxID=336963 RepID=C4JW51_UNCRE|nr:uncharacterized protein UREG_06793 [Uncinocarpus reesii 1704]EEP81928.1 predicted protein [Uncinocarpus reesii 1704]
MDGDESAPLLGQSASPSKSHRESHTKRSGQQDHDRQASETTPLLAREPQRTSQEDVRSIASSHDAFRPATSEQEADGKGNRVRWPVIISLVTLCLAAIAILVFGFAAPSALDEYATQAAVIEPIAVSIAAFTSSGVRARVQASFTLDASRVEKPIVRNLGRLATWVGREVESGESDIQVYLPEYGNILLGTATVPPIKVVIRNGHQNSVDFFADLKAGDVDGIRGVANDWLEGRLEHLRIKGQASVPLRSGLLSLGSHDVSETLVLQGQSLYMPFLFPFAFFLDLILTRTLPNCAPGDNYILIGNATSDIIEIEPKQPVVASVTGFVYEVPDALTTICPGKTSSPLDLLIQSYIKGLETVVYVRGGSSPTLPDWLESFFHSITVPVSIPSKGLSNLIKRFSMSNVHFSLPDPFEDPNSPEAQPRVSALVKTVVGLPEEMNVPLNISRVRTIADIYYSDAKLGYIDLQKWQNATVHRIEGGQHSPALLVEFAIKKAPLQIVDEDVFADVVKKVIMDRETIYLDVKANVSAELDTGLGKFVLRDIPASGNITVKAPLGGGGFSDFHPKIESIRISQTTKSSISLETLVNFTNPTSYSANVPYVDMEVIYNGSRVAHVLGRRLSVSPGLNSLVEIVGLWNPFHGGGSEGVIAGRELISSYISGLNTSVRLSPHSGSIPSFPALGKALSMLQIEVPLPKLHLPDDGDENGTPDDRPHFIKEATVWSTLITFMRGHI